MWAFSIHLKDNSTKSERKRILAEYDRRESEVALDLYAPWQPGEILMTSERKRIAALMLKEHCVFPVPGNRILEIGFGRLGWLADLLSWGLRETDLFGIELDPKRAGIAQAALPAANLMIGDATEMPWENDYFQCAIVSTVFSSVLDFEVQQLISAEIARVVSRGGVILVYDLRRNNPSNQNVSCLSRTNVEELFPGFICDFRVTTLAPPIARIVARRSWPLAVLLGSIPILKTHFIALLIKQ